jgi:hypothetical protein
MPAPPTGLTGAKSGGCRRTMLATPTRKCPPVGPARPGIDQFGPPPTDCDGGPAQARRNAELATPTMCDYSRSRAMAFQGDEWRGAKASICRAAAS